MTRDAVAAPTERRWVGRRVPRVEDPPLLRGEASFVDDLPEAGALAATFVRSVEAAGRITALRTAAAEEVPGVVAVWTARDLGLPGLRTVLHRPDYVPTTMPMLAGDRVRFAGEPVAMVVATDPYVAEDAAELVEVVVEPFAAVAGLDAAVCDGTHPVHDAAPTNVLIDAVPVDDPAIEDALAGAHVRVDEEIGSARVSATPLEARACLAVWDARERRLVVSTSTQLPHVVRMAIADQLGLPESAVRVIVRDVGGGFGQKAGVAREEVLVAAAAYRLRRPVRWAQDRRENLTADFQGHEQRYRASAAFDAEGRLQALDVTVDCDIGAYSSYPFSCALEPLMAAAEMPGVYRLPRYRVRARGVATNKPPIAPLRGVSRPQIVLLMERLMDRAASSLGLSRVDVRRRNLLGDGDFPYAGVNGLEYDAGSYRRALDLCADVVGFEAWPERQRAARSAGRRVGLGIVAFSERTAYGTSAFVARGMALSPGFDTAEVRMDASGTVTVAVGTAPAGQGHRTSLAQVAAEQLGIDMADVRVLQGDTDVVPHGWGTFASRTAVLSGGSTHLAAGGLAAKLRRLAAHVLEADADDIVLLDGAASVRGSPAAHVAIPTLAALAHRTAQDLPPDEEPGLWHRATFDPPGTFSNGAHAVEVEIDPGTGHVRLLRYVVVEDCGVVLNPAVVDGQIRGGVAQGIGFALLEQLRYDAAAQCTTSTMIDYLLPTAHEVPRIEIHHLETPSPHSATGAKGMGEAGTIGAPAAIASAVADAMSDVGYVPRRIPITPHDIVEALRRSARA